MEIHWGDFQFENRSKILFCHFAQGHDGIFVDGRGVLVSHDDHLS
jgi:hypothetical protein